MGLASTSSRESAIQEENQANDWLCRIGMFPVGALRPKRYAAFHAVAPTGRVARGDGAFEFEAVRVFDRIPMEIGFAWVNGISDAALQITDYKNIGP
jgi:hypothetical protein